MGLRKRHDELGAHVSSAGGVDRAPARAAELDARVLQLFTKQPSRWREPEVDEALAERFRAAREEEGIEVAGSHDSYLINLASPDDALRERSETCFQGELTRCAALGLDFLVTHPGNATDGDEAAGVRRNAEAVGRALAAVDAPTRVLLELTAGSGTSVGGSFDLLADILDRIPAPERDRVGVCVDTCHAWAAGYDLASDYDGVWARFGEVLDLELIGLFHLNDSKTPFASRKDRHEDIGEGTLGDAPFRRLLLDPRFRDVPKLIETPKEPDVLTADRRNLARLRALRAEG
ncbi:MAG: deoxyribonuclease IV [Gemmatimonadetes bacterium]|nr:deoxyribonuclease IV [Gemmatimonadota bacterium]